MENKNVLRFNWETMDYSSCPTHLRRNISLRLWSQKIAAIERLTTVTALIEKLTFELEYIQ